MKKPFVLFIILGLVLGVVSGCKKHPAAPADQLLQQVKDPILEEIYAFRIEIRQAYNTSRFDDLEIKAAELRASKAVFENGTWKISKFYSAFACSKEDVRLFNQGAKSLQKSEPAVKPAAPVATTIGPAGVTVPTAGAPTAAAVTSTAVTSRDPWFTLTSADGRTIRAELVSLSEDVLSIRRGDGAAFTFLIGKLSEADQQRVRDYFASAPAAGAPQPEAAQTPASEAKPVSNNPFNDFANYMDYLNKATDTK